MPFSYRVAAIALHEGQLLLHRGVNEQAWSLPGGRVEAMEKAREAMARELSEELGIEAEIGRLLWIVENFYLDEGEQYHELDLYFKVELPMSLSQSVANHPFAGIEREKGLIFQWFALEQVEKLPFNPSVLAAHLRQIPDQIVHLVSDLPSL